MFAPRVRYTLRMAQRATAYRARLGRAGRGLWRACRAGWRPGLVAALAVLLALLNPALCVIHCLVLHGGHAPAHAHHGHGAAAHAHIHHDGAVGASHMVTPAAHDHGGPAGAGPCAHQADGAGAPLPRALYELAPLAAPLLALTLLLSRPSARARVALRPLAPASPPTPPPRPVALP